jgi:ATPase subunit of ABC transporter with duplicated ATPase domains
MLTVANVTKRYSGRTLFDDVSVFFDQGNRYGLTGANGAGKSTFMKILAGDIEPDIGHVSYPRNARLSVLHQDHFKYEADRVRDVVVMGNGRLWGAISEKEALLARGEFDDETGMRLGELEVVIAEENGYDAEAEAEQLLLGLGIPAAQHLEPMSSLTGGMRVRVLLAQALFGKPDILLLDEPTNNLDLESIMWLEGFLLDFEGVLVVISHDRHFLNSVCTHTADVDYESIILYPGGYDEMFAQKIKARAQVERSNAGKKKKIEELQDFIRRFGANAKKASQAQSRRRQIEKIDMVDLKRSNVQRPFIRFAVREPSGRLVIEVKHLGHTYGDQEIIRDLGFTLTKGEKLAIVGPNGVGKTTLCRILAGQLAPTRGSFTLGHQVSVGYMPQQHEEGLGEAVNDNAYEWLHRWDDKATVQEVRGLLGRMLFPSEDAEKPVHVLSGGETARLLMSRLTLQQDNLLILDEPTNHLDLESIRALTEAMQKYEGTLVFVAHDQTMLDDVATAVLELKGPGQHDYFPGGYAEFLEKTGRSAKAVGAR